MKKNKHKAHRRVKPARIILLMLAAIPSAHFAMDVWQWFCLFVYWFRDAVELYFLACFLGYAVCYSAVKFILCDVFTKMSGMEVLALLLGMPVLLAGAGWYIIEVYQVGRMASYAVFAGMWLVTELLLIRLFVYWILGTQLIKTKHMRRRRARVRARISAVETGWLE